MEPKDNTQIESAEELEAEKQHLGEVKEDEIRSKVIEEYGFDPEDDKERIDKLVAEKVNFRKTLSTAIRQKASYRTKVTELSKNPPKSDTKIDDSTVRQTITEEFEKRDLESMEYPDDIKQTIQKIAKVEGITVRKALDNDYVKSKIDKWKKDNNADGAAISRTNRSGPGRASEDLGDMPDVDMNSEEGRKAYDSWKAEKIKQGF